MVGASASAALPVHSVRSMKTVFEAAVSCEVLYVQMFFINCPITTCYDYYEFDDINNYLCSLIEE
jgi:hypothetical protein